MALCDCRTHEVSFLPIQLCKCVPTNLQVVVYNESLVSIKNANGEASRASCETPTLKIPAVNSSKENMVKALKNKDITGEVAVQEVQYPVTEKLLQQRLVEEADYKFTTELSAKTYNKKSLDNFVPRSESNFLEYAELISHKLVSFENSAHYIGLLKNIMKLSMRNLKAADVKELASLVTTIANEKGVEAIAGKSKS
ncbi:Translation initiation factor eif3 subunit, partial [Thalictrum thalictroides]